MYIKQITLHSPDIDIQKRFYGLAMALPVEAERSGAITVSVGESRLTFIQSELYSPYHFAFEIPENQFEEARQWLSGRASILEDATGKSSFHFVDWNAHAVYFHDANGNIVELIARHNLPTTRRMPFQAGSIIRISEIGLPTPHVLKTVSSLKEAGLRPWRGAGSETFTAVGSEEGLLIVVQAGRPWMPQQHIKAEPAPIQLEIEGASDLVLPNLPFVIRATA